VAPTTPIHLRCGLIVGPACRASHFTYWLRRLAGGQPFLAPLAPDTLLQFVDVRDIAQLVSHLPDTEVRGRSTSPARSIRYVPVPSSSRPATLSAAPATLPGPPTHGCADTANITRSPRAGSGPPRRRSTAARHTGGLRNRPVEQTAVATVAADPTSDETYRKRANMSPSQERALIASVSQAESAPLPDFAALPRRIR